MSVLALDTSNYTTSVAVFDGKDGFLVSGPSQSGADVRVSYFEIDLEKLNSSSPYALVLDVLSGSGKINAYGLSAKAMADISNTAYILNRNAYFCPV